MNNQKEVVPMDLHTPSKSLDEFEEVTYPKIPFIPVDKDGRPLKTVDEFCREIDQAKSVAELNNLWNSYMIPHGRKYPLIYVRFMSEHLEEKARLINECRGLINRPFM